MPENYKTSETSLLEGCMEPGKLVHKQDGSAVKDAYSHINGKRMEAEQEILHVSLDTSSNDELFYKTPGYYNPSETTELERSLELKKAIDKPEWSDVSYDYSSNETFYETPEYHNTSQIRGPEGYMEAKKIVDKPEASPVKDVCHDSSSNETFYETPEYYNPLETTGLEGNMEPGKIVYKPESSLKDFPRDFSSDEFFDTPEYYNPTETIASESFIEMPGTVVHQHEISVDRVVNTDAVSGKENFEKSQLSNQNTTIP